MALFGATSRRLRRLRQAAAGWLLCAAAAGCGRASLTGVAVAAADTDEGTWRRPAALTLFNDDTLGLRAVDIFVRCNDRLADDTLSVRIVTRSPGRLRTEERLVLHFARTGRPNPLAGECITPYRRRVRWTDRGNYTLILTPVRPCAGIESVGLRIAPDTN